MAIAKTYVKCPLTGAVYETFGNAENAGFQVVTLADYLAHLKATFANIVGKKSVIYTSEISSSGPNRAILRVFAIKDGELLNVSAHVAAFLNHDVTVNGDIIYEGKQSRVAGLLEASMAGFFGKKPNYLSLEQRWV